MQGKGALLLLTTATLFSLLVVGAYVTAASFGGECGSNLGQECGLGRKIAFHRSLISLGRNLAANQIGMQRFNFVSQIGERVVIFRFEMEIVGRP